MAYCNQWFYAEDENGDYPSAVDPEIVIEKWNGTEYVIVGAYTIPSFGRSVSLEQGTSHTAQGLVPTSVDDWELPRLITFIPCQQDVTIIWKRICPDPYCSAISASNDTPESDEQINLWAEWGGGEGHYIESHVWNFGDGTSSSVSSPWKLWTNMTGSPVVYTVTLEVTNDCGKSETRTKNIIVQPAHVCPTPVVTSMGWTPELPNVGETVNFSATADAGNGETITTWYWEFGDGHTGFGETTTHEYDRQGVFDVSITVINSCNAWSEDYVDTITVTEPLGVVITICKGVEENCGLHRIEQIHSREMFTGGDRCAWLQHFCDFNCESVPWSITNTFDLSGFPVNYEIAVVHINAVGLMLNANYSFNVKWFDPDNVLISNITTDSFTGTYTLDEIDWIGYCPSEIYKNGDYRVEVDLLEDDFPVFQTIKQTFTITGITCPDPNCTFGVV